VVKCCWLSEVAITRFALSAVFAVLACSCSIAGRSTPDFSLQKRRFSALVCYDGGVSLQHANSAVLFAARVIERDLGIELETVLVEGIPAIEGSHYRQQLSTVIDSAYGHRFDIIYLMLSQPQLSSGLPGHGQRGYAEAIGTVGRHKMNLAWGISEAEPTYDGKVMAHEIGHLCGAEHSSSGIMFFNSGLLSLASGFSSLSQQQVSAALSKTCSFSSTKQPPPFPAARAAGQAISERALQ